MAGRIAVVTGSNQGIGYEIVKRLLREMGGGKVILTSRDVSRGEEAMKSLAPLVKETQLETMQLDITSPSSVSSFAAIFKEKNPSGLDILIHNAGFAFKQAATEPFEEQARKTIDVNYYGTKQFHEAMEPMLNKGARVIFVGSMAGSVKRYSADVQKRILGLSSVSAIDAFAEEFAKAAKEGKTEELGMAKTAYGMSKALVHAFVRVTAEKLSPRGILVASVCPGWCRTNMAGDKAPKSAEDGADTPTWLALADDSLTSGNTGKMFTERRLMDY